MAEITITYHANKGTGTYQDTGLTPGNSYTILDSGSTEIVRHGHTLPEWNTASDGSGTKYTAGSSITLGDDDIDLYAQWEHDGKTYYQVYYLPNGGTGYTIDKVIPGNTHTIRTAAQSTVTQDGYMIVCWNTNSEGAGTDYDSGDVITPTKHMYLYAQWKDVSYQIPDEPVYRPKIREILDTDQVKASTIVNPVLSQMIENTAAVKEQMEASDAEMQASIDSLKDAASELEAEKGQPSGLATLDESGKVPLEQLPSSVSASSEVYVETSTDSYIRTVNIPWVTSYDDLLNKSITIFSNIGTFSASEISLNVNDLGTVPVAFSMNGIVRTTCAENYMVIHARMPYTVMYDGTYFLLQEMKKFPATISAYGETTLEDAVDSKSTASAATPNAVRQAYDHAGEAYGRAEKAYLSAENAYDHADKAYRRADEAYEFALSTSGGEYGGNVYTETSSSATIRTVTVPDVESYDDLLGKVLTINPKTSSGASSWAATTLNVNGLGAKSVAIATNGAFATTAVATGSRLITVGLPYSVMWNGTYFALVYNVVTASTSQYGATKLDNTVTSTSTVLAATANAVRLANNEGVNARTAATNAQTTANEAKTAASTAQSAAETAQTAADAARTTSNTKAPANHASTGTEHGAGSASAYGHVKLSDSLTSASNAASGVAASSYAVKQAYDNRATLPTHSGSDPSASIGQMWIRTDLT